MKTTDQKLDELYDGIQALAKQECWWFLDSLLQDFTPRIWRTDLDMLLGYATATFPFKSKLPSRVKFLDICKKLYYDPEL